MALKEVQFRDFSGGVNTRDAASELSENEFPYSMNVTLDERGYLMKRLGYENRFVSALGTGKVSNLFYWATQNKLVSQIGASLHVDNAAAFKTFTTSDRCGMVEFLGNLFITHPVDGSFTYDGTTVSAVASGPKGDTAAVWQNKIWVNDVINPARLWRSDAGAVNFGVTAWTDLREKDSGKLVLLTGASGLDIAGRPGLLAFKEDSAYRINDPSTGAFTTIDASIGAGSNISGVNAYGRTYVINNRGIYSTDGLNPMREESRLIENLFQNTQIDQTKNSLMAAGRYQDRLFFSLPRTGSSVNNLALELNPQEGWIVPHSNAASAYASFGRNITYMVMGSPSVDGRIYNSHRGGSDAGSPIASEFQTRWMEPNDGRAARLRKARFVGLGELDAYARKDYQDESVLNPMHVNIQEAGPVYDDDASVYDTDDDYVSPSFQSYQDFYSIGVCRSVSVRLVESSSIAQVGPTVLGGTAAQERGAWTMAYISFLTIDLGST